MDFNSWMLNENMGLGTNLKQKKVSIFSFYPLLFPKQLEKVGPL